MTRQRHPEHRHVLSVYYGTATRWDHAVLERVQKALERECDSFDGLQANFQFDSCDAAREALLVVRALDVRAEGCGVGVGPTAASLDEAKRVMRRSYERHVRGKDER